VKIYIAYYHDKVSNALHVLYPYVANRKVLSEGVQEKCFVFELCRKTIPRIRASAGESSSTYSVRQYLGRIFTFTLWTYMSGMISEIPE